MNEKFADLERGVKQLERKLKEGSVLETGQRGSNKVSAMAQQLAKKTAASATVAQDAATTNGQHNQQNQPPATTTTSLQRSNSRLNLPPQGGSESCHFCAKRVYLMERMTAEGKFFHRGCFRCEYCATTLRLGGYAYVRDDVAGGLFFCTSHVSMTYFMRTKYLNGRQALQDRPDGAKPTVVAPSADEPLTSPSATVHESE